jgi:hypothetical protein
MIQEGTIQRLLRRLSFVAPRAYTLADLQLELREPVEAEIADFMFQGACISGNHLTKFGEDYVVENIEKKRKRLNIK